MARPTLLLITDLTNGSEEEDILIGDFLRRDFTVLMCHPDDSETWEDSVDCIIVRNYWHNDRYGDAEPWYARWRTKHGLPIHDDLYIKEGESKDYLLDLYRSGFPVIPSVDDIKDLGYLPETDTYFIKPKDGYSAINARKLSRTELLTLNPQHYLIQPFIDFEYEISFYYLDKVLQYTLYAPDTTKRWDLIEFKPSDADITFAEQFITWNKQEFGIERIDACRLRDGSLLLVEITDQGGVYLSVPYLPEETRTRFLEDLSDSLRSRCAG